MREATVTTDTTRKTLSREVLVKALRKWGLLIGLILLTLVFGLTARNFLTVRNVSNILRQGTIIGIMAVGMSFAMIVGDFDLSFASLAGLLNVIAILFINRGASPVLVFALTLCIGIFWGIANGILVVKVGIHAFIATLATMTIARGIIYWITRGKTLYGPYPESLTVIGRGNILYDTVPIATIIFVVVAIVAYILANHTKVGRYFYSVGGNPLAARYSGIKVDLYRMAGIAASSFCAAVAAMILTSKLTSAPPDAGEGYLMSVIPVVFLGTTFLKPGVVNIGGTVVATILMAVIENGLIMLNVPFYFKYMIQGAIIILAIASITGGGKKKLGGPSML